MTKRTDYIIPLQALIALAGFAALLYATHAGGIGLTPDSVVYVGAARNILAGRGYSFLNGESLTPQPVTHYPPLYPAILALLSATGLDALASARLLGALLFALNIFLVGFIVSRYARESFWLPILGSFLTLTATDVLTVHSMAWTEPLFIFFSLSGIFLLSLYLENSKPLFLILCATLVALGFLSRYVGAATVGAGALGILLLSRKSFLRRFGAMHVFVAVSSLPVLLFFLRNLHLSSAATDRRIVFHPIKLNHIVSAFSTASAWLLVGKVRTDVRAAAFAIQVLTFLAVALYFMRKGWGRRKAAGALKSLPHLLAFFVLCYLAFLVFTVSFVDYDTVFDDRSLAPVHVFLIAYVLCLAHQFVDFRLLSRVRRTALLLIFLLFAGSYLTRNALWMNTARLDGQGYANSLWRESATITDLRALPAGTLIYTNGYDAISILTGRASLMIPAKIDRATGRPNAAYAAELTRMSEELKARRGVLVYFENLSERWYLPTEEELEKQLRLRPLFKDAGADIYGIEE